MKESDQLKKLMESVAVYERADDPVQVIHNIAADVAVQIQEIAREADSTSNRALFGDMVEELGKDFLEALEIELNMSLRR